MSDARRVWAVALGVCAAAAALLVALLWLTSSGPALGQGTPRSNPPLVGDPVRDERGMADRANVVQTVDAVFTLFDAREWAAQRDLFADRVDVDFSSLGGTRAQIPREELIGGWRKAFTGDKTSLHSTSNHQVRISGDRADVYLHGYAYNRLARLPRRSDVWETWGTYHFALRRTADERWVVTREQYVSRRTAGNEAVRTATGRAG